VFFFAGNHNNIIVHGLEPIATISEIHTNVDGLSANSCKLILLKNKNIPTDTHYQELHRQESILRFVHGLSKTDHIALCTVINKILDVISGG
jgi:hypothetical protein